MNFWKEELVRWPSEGHSKAFQKDAATGYEGLILQGSIMIYVMLGLLLMVVFILAAGVYFDERDKKMKKDKQFEEHFGDDGSSKK